MPLTLPNDEMILGHHDANPVQMKSKAFFAVTPNNDRFWIGILYALFSAIPIPISTSLIYTLYKDRDLRRNPSYGIVARLLICDLAQVIAHVMTGFFIVFPNIPKVEVLNRLAGCDVTVIWLMSYPLVCELSIYRALIVTGKCKSSQLPLVLKILEGVFWILLCVDFFFCWWNKAVDFYAIYWDNDKTRTFGKVANILEVYFGIPALLIGYVIYISTLIHLMLKKKQFGSASDRRQEISLFAQTTFESIYCALLVFLWHHQDDWWPNLSDWWGFVTCLAWIIYYYWKSALLLMFNRTVRSKWLNHVLCRCGRKTRNPSIGMGARGSVMTTITPL